jgi:hypothetical protein
MPIYENNRGEKFKAETKEELRLRLKISKRKIKDFFTKLPIVNDNDIVLNEDDYDEPRR